MNYHLFRLQDQSQNSLKGMLDQISILTPALTQQGAETWGIFPGLFGLATNELYWVVMSSGELDLQGKIPSDSISIIEQWHLAATVRPVEHAPRTKQGVYVFRWFNIPNDAVDEAASLSSKAWETFEDDFDTQVQGLFAEQDRQQAQGTMLLVTWYKDLSVWQQSREPDPAAREFFYRRSQLMNHATPIATRLYLPA